MTSAYSSTGEGSEGALSLTASNNEACPLLVLKTKKKNKKIKKSAVALKSEMPHKNRKDELLWSERTIFKQRSLVKSGNWFDKTHGGVPARICV